MLCKYFVSVHDTIALMPVPRTPCNKSAVVGCSVIYLLLKTAAKEMEFIDTIPTVNNVSRTPLATYSPTILKQCLLTVGLFKTK